MDDEMKDGILYLVEPQENTELAFCNCNCKGESLYCGNLVVCGKVTVVIN